jgi:hypothetical protein
VTNTVIRQTTIINNITNIRYVNRNVPGAMVAMPAPQFASAAPTVRSGLVLPPGVARAAPVLAAPQARPVPQSRLGPLAGHRPPAPLLQRMAVTRALPPGAFAHADRRVPAAPDARLAARAPVPPLRVLRPALGRQVTPQPWRGPAPGAAAGGRQFAQAGQPGGPGARGPQPAQPGQPVHGMMGQVPVARDTRPDHPGVAAQPQAHRPDPLAGGVPQPGAPGAPGVVRQHGRFVPGAPAMQAEGPGRPAVPPPGGHPQAPRAPDAAPGRGPAEVAQHGGRTPPQAQVTQTGPHWAAQGGVPTAQASGPMEAPAARGDAGRAMNRHGRPPATPQPAGAQAGPRPETRGAAPHPDRQPQRAAVQAPQPAPHGPAPQPHPQPAAHPPAPHPQPQAAPHAPAPRPQPAPHAPQPAPQPAPRPAPHEAPHPPAQAAHPQPQPHAAPQHGPDKGGDHGHKKGEQGGH